MGRHAGLQAQLATTKPAVGLESTGRIRLVWLDSWRELNGHADLEL